MNGIDLTMILILPYLHEICISSGNNAGDELLVNIEINNRYEAQQIRYTIDLTKQLMKKKVKLINKYLVFAAQSDGINSSLYKLCYIPETTKLAAIVAIAFIFESGDNKLVFLCIDEFGNVIKSIHVVKAEITATGALIIAKDNSPDSEPTKDDKLLWNVKGPEKWLACPIEECLR